MPWHDRLQPRRPRGAICSPTSPAPPISPRIEHVRVAALGKKGRVAELMQKLGSLAAGGAQGLRATVNALKARVSEALEARKGALEAQALDATARERARRHHFACSARSRADGRIHPVSQVFDECVEIFADMGFAVAEGPDIETDDLNFTKLNIPAEHPARQEHDTFYFHAEGRTDRGCLLRTHTSPVQIRTMLTQKPPIRIIAPGRVYRCDSDQTHTPMFHQIEGLVIDETTHMGHLEVGAGGVLQGLLRGRRGEDALPRLALPVHRAVDGSRYRRRGASASRVSGWRFSAAAWCTRTCCSNCGLDPEKYQGFAFGMGLDRLAMLKYGLPDLRDFFSADLRWLRHYGFSVLDVPTLAGGLSA